MASRVAVGPVTDALDALFADRKATLGVPEVAELLGVTKQGIYHWLRDGVIPGYKVGASWFILRDELKATLRAGANPRHAGVELIPPDQIESGADAAGETRSSG